MTRGQRNNNPLNIRRSTDRWLGMCENQTDKDFVQFTSVEYGIRASAKIIKKYINHYHCNTIRKIISRWAPSAENDTERYIDYVSNKTNISPVHVITWQDKHFLCSLLSAMAFFESRTEITPIEVENIFSRYVM